MIPAAFALVGAAGLAGLLTRGDRLGAARRRSLLAAGGTLALLGWLGVAHTLRAHAAPSPRPALVVALALGIVAARRASQRWPLALPFAACIAAPFRFPVHIGSQDANLLVPLYAVIGVAFLALVLDALRGSEPVRLPSRRLALPIVLLLAWEGASLAWSASATEGAKALGVLRAAVRRPARGARGAPAAAPAPRRPAARPGRARARVRGRRRLPGARATTSGGTAS